MKNITLSEPPFLSIQGEGQRIGRPTVFVRTYICPLRCAHCDSKNTWGIKRESKGKRDPFGDKEYQYTMEELIIAVKKLGNVREICLTGGEPMIEGNGAFFKDFQWGMQEEGYFLTIETSGTIFNTKMLKAPMSLWSICPHFPCSMTAYHDWVKYDVLNAMIMKIRPRNLQLKMLISNDRDLKEAKILLNKLSPDAFNKLLKERVPIIINPDCEANWVEEVYTPELEAGFKTTAKSIPTTIQYLDAVRTAMPMIMADPLLSQFNIAISTQFHKLIGVV